MKTTTIIVLAFVAMVFGTFMLAKPTSALPRPNPDYLDCALDNPPAWCEDGCDQEIMRADWCDY